MTKTAKTAKIIPITPKTKLAKPLTAKQYERMLTDRTEEIADIMLTHIADDAISEDAMEDLRQAIEANYLADKGLDAPPC